MQNSFQRQQLIFCVDDDPDMLAMITMLLRQRRYLQVRTFADAGSAIRAVHEMLPDLVLFDVLMPDMDGLTAYKKMRDNERFRGIKIAFVTGRKRLACMDQYTELGVPVLTKPFNIVEFEKFLRSIL